MAGRVYDDGPDRESVWDQDRDTWWAESRHELEPRPLKIQRADGVPASAWDHITPRGLEADDFARQMWGDHR